MRWLFTFQFTGLLALLCALNAGCKRDLTPDDTDNATTFPIELRLTQYDDSVHLEWPVINTALFKRYILLRSTDTLEVPLGVALSASSVVFSSTDVEASSFGERLGDFTPTGTNYRLFVELKDRNIGSNVVGINNFEFVRPGNGQTMVHYPDSNWVVIYSKILNVESNEGGEISVVDLNTMRLIATTVVPSPPSPFRLALQIARVNDRTEVLFWMGSNARRFRLPDMAELPPMAAGLSSTSVVVWRNFYIAAQVSSTKSTAIRRLDDLSEVTWESRPNYPEQRTLSVIDAESGLIGEFSSSHIVLRRIDENGLTVPDTKKSFPGVSGVINTNTPVSPDRQFFCPGRWGRIYNQQGMQVGTVPPTGEKTDLSFDPNGNYIYALFNDGQPSQGTKISRINFPALTTVDNKILKGIFPLRIIGQPDNSVILLGWNAVFEQPRFILKKIKF
jgi:hypothetical protein